MTMAVEPEPVGSSLALADDPGFRADVSALRAKATLKDLLGAPPDYRWPYTAERTVRNAAALHLSLSRLAIGDPERVDDFRAAARVAAQAWEGLATLEERTARS